MLRRGDLQQLLECGQNRTPRSSRRFIWPRSRSCPEPAELDGIQDAIGIAQDREEALKDFVWAVLCSREFAENH